MKICECKDSSYTWVLAINENGWKCVGCDGMYNGEPVGYAPHLDVDLIEEKAECVLLDLTDDDFISISNGSEGEVLVGMIANRCRNENRYDQYSIIHYALDLIWHEHADYWRKIGMGIRSGRDPRDRCSCGKLATSWCGADRWCSECSMKHYNLN